VCDLNTASVEALSELPGVGPALAYDLLLWRPYLTWSEVERVPGFDWEKVETLKASGAELRIPH
jgi:DNA uptake protein ComE-like DNA-binding protein